MPKYKKTQLTLPEWVSDAFSKMEISERNDYVRALRRAGWTLQSISTAAGITRERVRQIVGEPDNDPSNLTAAVPTPPEKPEHVSTPREYVEPDPANLARLLELKPLAQRVRSNSPKYREEAEEYTRIIAELHLEDGVTLYRLAKRLGVTHGALRFRLARYGYKLPASGSSKVYTPILDKNRPVNGSEPRDTPGMHEG